MIAPSLPRDGHATADREVATSSLTARPGQWVPRWFALDGDCLRVFAADVGTDKATPTGEPTAVVLGLSRIVALYHRPPTSSEIC